MFGRNGILLSLSLMQSITIAHSPSCEPRQVIKIRLPPSIDTNVDTSPPKWEPMPPGWYYGNWFVAYSSNKVYQGLQNLNWDLSPVLPTCGLAPHSTPANCAPGTYPGQLNDLSTWTVNDTRSVYSAFAYDTPRRVNNASAGRGWDDVWDTVGAGTLSYFQQGWEILAWGYDESGNGWMLNYELAVAADKTPPCVDILSRVAAGPPKATVAAIYNAVKGLGSAELNGLMDGVRKLDFNGKRRGLPPFVCGPDCVNNTDPSAGNI